MSMDKLNFIYPEIFISLSIMFLLIFGVFKKNSSNLINSLSILTLIGSLVLIFNYPIDSNLEIFGLFRILFHHLKLQEKLFQHLHQYKICNGQSFFPNLQHF